MWVHELRRTILFSTSIGIPLTEREKECVSSLFPPPSRFDRMMGLNSVKSGISPVNKPEPI